jgi:hypothetical protein
VPVEPVEQRKAPRGADEEATFIAELIKWAQHYGRHHNGEITALLRAGA